MTLFAVACAGLFPLLHLGRPWLAYWLLPYPEHDGRCGRSSAARWSGTCSRSRPTPRSRLLFWYVGLIPDLATLRDRATAAVRQVVYGILAMGWRGAARHWQRYETAYLLLAGLATPLVVSVHTVVSFDFAVGDRARLARDDLPALLRGRRDLLGLRDGADARDPAARALRARGLHHAAPPRQHGQGDARDRADRGLRLRDGGLLGLVQRQPVRAVHDRRTASSGRTAGPTGRCSCCNVVMPQLLWLQRVRTRRRCCSRSRSSSTSACGSSAS